MTMTDQQRAEYEEWAAQNDAFRAELADLVTRFTAFTDDWIERHQTSAQPVAEDSDGRPDPGP